MRLILLLVVAVVAGFIAGTLYAQSDAPAPVATTGDDLDADIAALAGSDAIPPGLATVLGGLLDRLEQADADRAAITASLDELRETLANQSAAEAEQNFAFEDESPPPELARARRQGVSASTLEDAGFTPAQAESIVQLADEATYARLQLRFNALRENWTPSELREASNELPTVRSSLIEQYGEDGYDRYLYAAGQPNRVVVRSTLQGSPAQSAGIRAGDILYALDDQRVFSNADLLRIAAEGEAGEQVPITVLRDGSKTDLYLPRGPLGLTSRRALNDPDDD